MRNTLLVEAAGSPFSLAQSFQPAAGVCLAGARGWHGARGRPPVLRLCLPTVVRSGGLQTAPELWAMRSPACLSASGSGRGHKTFARCGVSEAIFRYVCVFWAPAGGGADLHPLHWNRPTGRAGARIQGAGRPYHLGPPCRGEAHASSRGRVQRWPRHVPRDSASLCLRRLSLFF